MKRLDPDALFSVSYRTIRVILLFGAAAIIIAAFWRFESQRPTLTFAGAALAAAAALHNAYLARKTFEMSVRDKKLAIAGEFYGRFYGTSAKDMRDTFQAFSREHQGKGSQDIIKSLDEDEKVRTVVFEVLNLWEEVGYAVRESRTEIYMVENLFGSAYLNSYRLAQPLFAEHRRKHNQPTAWEHFEWCCKEMETRKAKQS